MIIKNWSSDKGSLTWYYRGSNQKVRDSVEKVYVDHFVPAKGWRFVIVGKYSWDNYESYSKTKAQALKKAYDYMKGVE